MGSSESKQMSSTLTQEYKENKIPKPRFLCVHGWRTSGPVLQGQMKAFNDAVNIECQYINAPFVAVGPPDELISMFYPSASYSYYEWYLDENNNDIQSSIDALLLEIETNGPYDGLLGFSQGAEMCTRLCLEIQEKQIKSNITQVILIGGVYPGHRDETSSVVASPTTLAIKSLHIMGSGDPYLVKSKQLVEWYDSANSTVIVHNEMHNIPSPRTNVYADINKWLAT